MIYPLGSVMSVFDFSGRNKILLLSETRMLDRDASLHPYSPSVSIANLGDAGEKILVDSVEIDDYGLDDDDAAIQKKCFWW